MVLISTAGKVGLSNRGLVVKGGSRITGSFSVCEKLPVRALGTRGAGGPGTDGGTISSGSRKYIHLQSEVNKAQLDLKPKAYR
jgi:hypothetical protein